MKVNQIMRFLQGHLKIVGQGLILAGFCAVSFSQTPPPQRPENIKRMAARHEENLARFGTSSNHLVRYGLLADRTGRWVRIAAEACGHKSPTPTEFFLISTRSGHDYESLAVSFASGRDLHDALEFIGLPPGLPIDPAARRFWPKGERVRTEFAWSDSNGTHRAIAEELILDQRTGQALPQSGLVFTGSRRVRLPGSDRSGYAADEIEPQALAANFNHPDLVLDVPRQAAQGDVYSQLVPHPAFALSAGQPLDITFTPEYADGRRRVQNLTLTVRASPGSGLPAFDLARDSDPMLTNETVTALLAAFSRITAVGQDPFVTVRFAADLSLRDAQAAARLLASIEGNEGIRVDAPPPGDFYYRALIPQESLRQRANRPSQPWEFHWPSTALGNATGTLTRIQEEWDDAGNDFKLKSTDFPVSRPEEVATVLKREEGTRVVFVYLPPDTPYHAIRSWIQVIQPTHPTVFVYADHPAGASTHD